MEGYDFVEHDCQPLPKPAFQAIRDALMHAQEPITLVAIGPLTNIALLLTQYPECRFNIRRLVIMGGSAGRGNFTPMRSSILLSIRKPRPAYFAAVWRS
jgi:non-specific riboncleoside hydrolase